MSIPLSTIKSALRIDYTDDDAELIRLREAALSLVERRTALTLSPQSKALYLRAFEDTVIDGFPFTAVTNVQYYDGGNTLTTMPATDYWIDRTEGNFPYIRFLEQPGIYQGTAITVNYTCGYSALPNEIVHAAIALIGAWYNNPEALTVVGLAQVPLSLEYIIDAAGVRSPMR